MALVKPENVAQMARDLSKTAASPAFLELIRSIQAAPETEKLATAQNVADVHTLMQHGIEPPADFRITTRTFEEPHSSSDADISDSPQITCDLNRIVFTFKGVVTVIEVIHESD